MVGGHKRSQALTFMPVSTYAGGETRIEIQSFRTVAHVTVDLIDYANDLALTG